MILYLYHDRFKGSLVDTASVDFSDRIRNTRRKGKIEKNTPDK